MSNLKIYLASTGERVNGIENILVIADSKEQAMKLIEFDDDVSGIYKETDLVEIPFRRGCTYIGEYTE